MSALSRGADFFFLILLKIECYDCNLVLKILRDRLYDKLPRSRFPSLVLGSSLAACEMLSRMIPIDSSTRIIGDYEGKNCRSEGTYSGTYII